MKRIFTLIIIGFLTISCTDDENCCTVIDIGVDIKYLNENGENLFDISNGFDFSKINAYHKNDGNWEKYFEGNLDYPKGLMLVERKDGTYLRIFPSTTIVENNISESKIEFSENDSDILKTEITKTNSNTIVKKVWYNGELKWESGKTERLFEIIK